MKAVAVVLMLALPATGQDMRADAGVVGSTLGTAAGAYENADAGVYQVSSATRFDGGALPQGWWLAPARMQRYGEKVVELENENLALKSSLETATAPIQLPWGFWAGLVVGVAAGIGGTVLIVRAVDK